MAKPLRSRFNNLYWERRLGISSRGTVDIENPDSVYYATMDYSAISKVLQRLELQPFDVFVDIGCGKGRVLCCVALAHLRKAIGIDVSPELSAIARKNAQRLRGRHTPIAIYTGMAQDFDYSEGTVFFLFNPFGARTLDACLAKIHSDVANRPVRIAYATPTHNAVFDKHDWLERYDDWESVFFYRSVGWSANAGVHSDRPA
jgi:predicted RNA methylase